MPKVVSTQSSSDQLRLECRQLVCGYMDPLLPAIDFALKPGEVCSVTGPNGCGKSTLFKTLLGILPSLSGQMVIDRAARQAYMEQHAHIENGLNLSVRDVVRSGLVRGQQLTIFSKHTIDIQSTVEAFELDGLMHKSFHYLSGGQKQRVLLAKEFVSRPSLLFLDEPTSAMDPMMAHKTFDLIRSLADSHQCTILLISHEANVIPEIADKVLFLDAENDAYRFGSPHDVTSSPEFERRYRFHYHSHDMLEPCSIPEGMPIRFQVDDDVLVDRQTVGDAKLEHQKV